VVVAAEELAAASQGKKKHQLLLLHWQKKKETTVAYGEGVGGQCNPQGGEGGTQTHTTAFGAGLLMLLLSAFCFLPFAFCRRSLQFAVRRCRCPDKLKTRDNQKRHKELFSLPVRLAKKKIRKKKVKARLVSFIFFFFFFPAYVAT